MLENIKEAQYLIDLGVKKLYPYKDALYFMYGPAVCRLRVNNICNDKTLQKVEYISKMMDRFYEEAPFAEKGTILKFGLSSIVKLIKLFKTDISKHKVYRFDNKYFSVIGCQYGVIECIF